MAEEAAEVLHRFSGRCFPGSPGEMVTSTSACCTAVSYSYTDMSNETVLPGSCCIYKCYVCKWEILWMRRIELSPFCLLLCRFTCVALCLFQVREFLSKLDELVEKVSYENDPIRAQKPVLQKRTDSLLEELLKRFHLEKSPKNYFQFFSVSFHFFFFFFNPEVLLWLKINLPCLRVKGLWFSALTSSSVLRPGQCSFISYIISSYTVCGHCTSKSETLTKPRSSQASCHVS